MSDDKDLDLSDDKDWNFGDDKDYNFDELKDKTPNQEYLNTPSLDGSRVYVIRNRRKLGPFLVEHLTDMVEAGMIDYNDLAVPEGYATFIPVDQIIKQLKSPSHAGTDTDPSLQIRELYITHDGKISGPYTLMKAEILLSSGLVKEADMVTHKGCLQPVPLGLLLASVKRATIKFKVSDLENFSEQIKTSEKSKQNAIKTSTSKSVSSVKFLIPFLVIVILGSLTIVFLKSNLKYSFQLKSSPITILIPSQNHQEIIANLLYAFADFKKLSVSSDYSPDNQSKSIILSNRTRFNLISSLDEDIGTGEQTKPNLVFCSYRGLSPRKEGETEHLLGYEGLIVIANRKKSLTHISKVELISLMSIENTFSDKDSARQDGLPSIFIPSSRNKSWTKFNTHFPDLKHHSSLVQPMDSDSNIISAVDSIPNSLGIIPFNSREHNNIIAVSQRNTLPSVVSVFNLRTEDYPLSDRISFIIPSNRKQPQVQELLEFLNEPSAHNVLEKHGIVPPAVKLEYPTMIWQVPMDYRNTVQNYARLSTSIRFDRNTQFDIPTKKNLELVADFITKNAPAKKILLVGFAPETGQKSMNDSLSRIFSFKVSTWFQDMKINNLSIHTFGSSIPVVDDDSPESFWNARVEVWVEP